MECIVGSECTVDVARWRFNEGEGNTAFDSVGDHDGALTNVSYTVGCVEGACADFNGPSSVVVVPDDDEFDLMSSMNLSFWLWLNQVDTGGRVQLFSKRNQSGSGPGWHVFFYNNDFGNEAVRRRVGFSILNFTADSSFVSVGVTSEGHQLSSQTWYHVQATYDGDALRIFIDDSLSGEFTFPGHMPVVNDEPIRFGGSFFGGGIVGRIDDVELKR